MAHDVFISYSHHDKAVADAICNRLESDGIRCWYAPRDIEPGANWARAIMDTIETVKVMVLIFTDYSNASPQVFNEITNAVNARVVIIPFKLTDSEPSKDLKYYISAVHWLDAMDKPLAKSIEALSRQVRAVLDKGSGTPPPPPPSCVQATRELR